MTDKFCKDCRWCLNTEIDGSVSVSSDWYCWHAGAMKADPVTGEKYQRMCVYMRAEPEQLNKWHMGNPHCGPDGALFEPKQ